MDNQRAKTASPNPGLRAFVLCGGLGTRLRAVVSDRPKSMALVAGVPFLQIVLDHLGAQGIQEITLGTGYLGDQIEAHFGEGHDLGLTIRYSCEQEPLGTGGAAKLAENFLSEPALILNGDSYVEWNLAPMLQLAEAREADLVMALQSVADVGRYGSVVLNEEGRVIEFVEKGIGTGSGLINAGVYLLNKKIIGDLPKGQPISLEREVFPHLLGRRVYGVVSEGPFIDIGIPEDLQRAQILLASKVHP